MHRSSLRPTYPPAVGRVLVNVGRGVSAVGAVLLRNRKTPPQAELQCHHLLCVVLSTRQSTRRLSHYVSQRVALQERKRGRTEQCVYPYFTPRILIRCFMFRGMPNKYYRQPLPEYHFIVTLIVTHMTIAATRPKRNSFVVRLREVQAFDLHQKNTNTPMNPTNHSLVIRRATAKARARLLRGYTRSTFSALSNLSVKVALGAYPSQRGCARSSLRLIRMHNTLLSPKAKHKSLVPQPQRVPDQLKRSSPKITTSVPLSRVWNLCKLERLRLEKCSMPRSTRLAAREDRCRHRRCCLGITYLRT